MSLHWIGVAWAVLVLALVVGVPAFLAVREAWRDVTKDLP